MESRLLRRYLAALISASGHGSTRDELCDLLWPESDGDRATRTFYAATNDIRRLLAAVPGIRLSLRDRRYRLVLDDAIRHQ